MFDLSNYWNSKEKSHIQKCSVHFGTTCLGKSHFILVNVLLCDFKEQTPGRGPGLTTDSADLSRVKLLTFLKKREHYPLVFPAERKQDQSLYFTLEYLLDISSSFLPGRLSFIISASLFFPQPFFVAVCCSTSLVLVGGTFMQSSLNMNKFNLSKSNWFHANAGTL